MPIDPSIALQVKPLQIESPINLLTQGLQLQALQRQNALADAQAQTTRDTLQRQQAFRNRLASGVDLTTPAGQNALVQEFPDLGPTLVESILKNEGTRATTGKTVADTKKATAETADKALQTQREMLTMVRTPQQFASWVDAMYANPATADVAKQFGSAEDVKARIPQDPAQFQQYLQQNAMGMDKYIQNQATLRGQDLTYTASRENNRDTNATTRRGQDLTDARERERLTMEKNAPKGQFLDTPNGYVLGDPRTGATAPVIDQATGKQVQGKSADRALTDSQAKANLFGSRAKESDRIITSLEGKYWPGAVNAKVAAGEVPVIGGAAGAAANWMLTEEGQQAEQAQRDFLNAVLRRESGAVISPAEFSNGAKQYFPQPNDKPGQIAQKKRNRQLAVEGILSEVPEGKRGVYVAPAPAGSATTTDALPADIQALLAKHGSKGK